MTYGGNSPDLNPTNNDHQPAQIYQDDDIRVEYHPNSGRCTNISKIDEYRQSVPGGKATLEPEPWAPFRTREDFEFTELVLDAGMKKGQVKALIKLFHKCIEGEGSFTIPKYKDMEDTLKLASNRLAKVQQMVLTHGYISN